MSGVPDTVMLRAGNGSVQRYDLPLRPAFADAVAAGRLVVVEEDDQTADPGQAEVKTGRPPAKSATVAEWRTWATDNGAPEDEISTMTKTQIIDTYTTQEA